MKIINTATMFVVSLFLFYLLGSFCGASFNIAEWEPEARSLGALVSFIISCGISLIVYQEGSL